VLKTLRLDCSILVYAAPDVPGQWVSHCLNFDIMSQGNSPSHARASLVEAVALSAADDHEVGRSVFERNLAPVEDWERFEEIMRSGAVRTFDHLDSGAGPGDCIASIIHLFLERPDAATEPFQLPARLGRPSRRVS
jgi:hypothetical protein